MSSSGESAGPSRAELEQLDDELQQRGRRRDLLPVIAALDVGLGPDRALARFLHADALYYCDHDDEALEKFREALALAREDGDRRTACRALYRLVEWNRYKGLPALTTELAEAEGIAQSLNEAYLRARGHRARAQHAVDAGAHAQAVPFFELALRGYVAGGRKDLVASVVKELCVARAEAGVEVDLSVLGHIAEEDKRFEVACEVGAMLLDRRQERSAQSTLQFVLDNAPMASESCRWARALKVACRQHSATMDAEDVAWLLDDANLQDAPDLLLLRIVRSLHWLRVGAAESAKDEAERGLAELTGQDEPPAPLRRAVLHARRAFAACLLGSKELAQSCIDESRLIARTLEAEERIGALETVIPVVSAIEGPGEAARLFGDLSAAARAARLPSSALYLYESLRAQYLALDGRPDEARAVLAPLLQTSDLPPLVAGLVDLVEGRLASSPELLERGAVGLGNAGMVDDATSVMAEAAALYASRDDLPRAFAALERAVRSALLGIHLAPLEEDRLRLQSAALRLAGYAAAAVSDDEVPRAFRLAVDAKSAALRRLELHRANHIDKHPVIPAPRGIFVAPSLAGPPPGLAQFRDALAGPHVDLDHIRTFYRDLAKTDATVGQIEAMLDVPAERIIAAIPADAAAIDFLVGEDDIHMFVVVDGVVHRASAQWTPDIGAALITAFWILQQRSTIPRRRQPAALAESLSSLYDFLVRPLLPLIGDKRTWLLSPGSRLAHVPFAALFDGTKHVIEEHDLLFTMTLARLPLVDWSMKLPRTASVIRGVDEAVAGHLLHADREAERIAAAAAARGITLIGSGDPFGGELVHYVGHATQHSDHWMAATLFPPGGPISAPDLLARDLRHVLHCTLSACETGKPNWDSSDEYGGFLRACFAAGARQALVTQWPADDEGTTALMEKFYELWLDGAPFSQALGSAVRHLIDGDGGSSARRNANLLIWANVAGYI